MGFPILVRWLLYIEWGPWWHKKSEQRHGPGYHDDVINGNIFRVTGHLCGEFTSQRWIPRTKASDAEFWCFLWLICTWINSWVNNREAGDFRCHWAHYDVTVMSWNSPSFSTREIKWLSTQNIFGLGSEVKYSNSTSLSQQVPCSQHVMGATCGNLAGHEAVLCWKFIPWYFVYARTYTRMYTI